MTNINGSIVYVGNQEMALLRQSYTGLVMVEPFPACSLGTYLKIVSWVRDLGYEAK